MIDMLYNLYYVIQYMLSNNLYLNEQVACIYCTSNTYLRFFLGATIFGR